MRKETVVDELKVLRDILKQKNKVMLAKLQKVELELKTLKNKKPKGKKKDC